MFVTLPGPATELCEQGKQSRRWLQRTSRHSKALDDVLCYSGPVLKGVSLGPNGNMLGWTPPSQRAHEMLPLANEDIYDLPMQTQLPSCLQCSRRRPLARARLWPNSGPCWGDTRALLHRVIGREASKLSQLWPVHGHQGQDQSPCPGHKDHLEPSIPKAFFLCSPPLWHREPHHPHSPVPPHSNAVSQCPSRIKGAFSHVQLQACYAASSGQKWLGATLQHGTSLTGQLD